MTSLYFSRQPNIYSFCMEIQLKASRCEVGGRMIYPANFTSTCFPRRVSRCWFGGEYIILPPTSHLPVFQEEWVDVGLAGNMILPPTSHLLIFQEEWEDIGFGGNIILPPTSYLLVFNTEWVDVGLAGNIILPPTSHLLVFQEEWVDVKLVGILVVDVHLEGKDMAIVFLR